jgi:hypothetical protein
MLTFRNVQFDEDLFPFKNQNLSHSSAETEVSKPFPLFKILFRPNLEASSYVEQLQESSNEIPPIIPVS